MSRRPSLMRNAPALTLSTISSTSPSELPATSTPTSSSFPSITGHNPAATTFSASSNTFGRSTSSVDFSSSSSSLPGLTFSSSPSPTSTISNSSTPMKADSRLYTLPELRLPDSGTTAPRSSFSFGAWAGNTWGQQAGKSEDMMMDVGASAGLIGGFSLASNATMWEVDSDGDALMVDAF